MPRSSNYFRPGNLGSSARAGLAVAGRPGGRGTGKVSGREGHRGQLAGPRADRRRVDRRPRGSSAHPPRRHASSTASTAATCWRSTSAQPETAAAESAAGARGAAAAGPGPGRQLPHRGRGRSGRRAAGLRPQRQRHPDRRRHLTPQQARRTTGGPSRRAHRHPGGPRRRVPSTFTSRPSRPKAEDRVCPSGGIWAVPALRQVLPGCPASGPAAAPAGGQPGQESGDSRAGTAHRLRRGGAGRRTVARDPRGALEQPAGELLLHPAGGHPHHQRFAERAGPPGVCRGVRRRRHRCGPLRAAFQGSGPRQGGSRHPGGPHARGGRLRRTRSWDCWSKPWTSSRSGARPF